jgi:hypothetical protein
MPSRWRVPPSRLTVVRASRRVYRIFCTIENSYCSIRNTSQRPKRSAGPRRLDWLWEAGATRCTAAKKFNGAETPDYLVSLAVNKLRLIGCASITSSIHKP